MDITGTRYTAVVASRQGVELRKTSTNVHYIRDRQTSHQQFISYDKGP